MDYNQLTKLQFEEIMESLTGGLWLKVVCDSVPVNVFYPEFEFLVFNSGKYQFGHLEYDEENNFQNIIIDADSVVGIHRCSISPMFCAEQIILTMFDDVRIFLETENC